MFKSLAQLLPPRGAAVMGILNITPDSFSDGGELYSDTGIARDSLLRQAELMASAGVHFFDVGGESTRPGAKPVSTAEELARVVPVVELLKSHFDVPISVDTSNPEVIRAAADAGVHLINDVRALSRPGALAAAADAGLPVCIMHMSAEPGVMQNNPSYANVVVEVGDYLRQRVAQVCDAGIARENIAVDPGFGFGKNLSHNLALFRALPELVAEGLPVLVGVSRKRMIGEMLNREQPRDRIQGSVALALLAAQAGARIIRVHDVVETLDALKVLAFVEGTQS
jgi:dihydropteroate synthase